MTSALEKWRERCARNTSSEADTKYAAKCCSWCDRPEQAIARLELVGGQMFIMAGPSYQGVRLALSWLREAIDESLTQKAGEK